MRVFGFCIWPCLFFLCTSPALPAELPLHPSPVTVLLNYDLPYSQVSFDALERQAQQLLGDAGIRLDIRQRKDTVPREEFSEVLMFEMKGHCSMQALPVDALSDERGALAMAYSADGNILPFGEVECDQVRKSLQRILGRGAAKADQGALGTALGMVLAHEIYHMLSHSAEHTRAGVTKESLSAREMLDGKLSITDAARLAIDHSIPSRH